MFIKFLSVHFFPEEKSNCPLWSAIPHFSVGLKCPKNDPFSRLLANFPVLVKKSRDSLSLAARLESQGLPPLTPLYLNRMALTQALNLRDKKSPSFEVWSHQKLRILVKNGHFQGKCNTGVTPV